MASRCPQHNCYTAPMTASVSLSRRSRHLRRQQRRREAPRGLQQFDFRLGCQPPHNRGCRRISVRSEWYIGAVTQESEPPLESQTRAEAEGRRYRAYTRDAAGKIEDVAPEKLIGVEQFLDSWERSPETPHEVVGSGWQGPDDAHLPGSGQPAYRVVYKTLKMAPYPAISLEWPNLRVTIQNGDVGRGGMTAPTAVPGRSPRHHIIPEYGRLVGRPEGVLYLSCPDMNIQMGGWEETVKALSYVEIICHVEDVEIDDYEALMVKGRQVVASLKTLLDLKLGPRLFAMPITEEIGETFEDWHWNRRINTGLVSIESQVALRHINATTITNEVIPLIDQQQALRKDERRRLMFASQWYWRADAEPEHTTRFINWWLVVESLEMAKTTDIRPIREPSRSPLQQRRACVAQTRRETVRATKQGVSRRRMGGAGRTIKTSRAPRPPFSHYSSSWNCAR